MKKTIVSILLMIIIFYVMATNVTFATTGVITATTVRLRREPNTSSDVMELINENTEVEILGEEGDWYRVRYDNLVGYVSSEYVDVLSSNSSSNSTPSSEEPTNTVSSNTSNTTSNLPDGVSSTTNNTSNISNETSAPIDSSNTTNTSNITFDNSTIDTATVTEFNLSKNAELRTIPSFSSNKVNTIPAGTNVTVIDTLNNWVKITDGVNSGWVIRQNV